MKLSIGKLDAHGVASCGHTLSSEDPVLSFEHGGEVGYVCMRRECYRLFVEADARVDAAGDGLRTKAEAAASAAIAEKRAEWNDAEDNAARAAELADKAAEEAKWSLSLTKRRAAVHARTASDRAKAQLAHHRAHERTPAFHGAIVWALVARDA
jgi:hypothetical protein